MEKQYSSHTQMDTHPVVLFDGVCNLCDSSVQWLIKHDPDGIFKFAALQSDEGQALLRQFNFPTDELSTVVLIDQDQMWIKSDVALEIAKKLGAPYSWIYPFRFLPKAFRDSIYRWVANNRYRWFGEKDQCMMPTPELKQRFL